MKTLDNFKSLVPILNDTILGKTGMDYFQTLFTFTEENNFRQSVYKRLFEDDLGKVVFITDDIFNQNGILHVEIFEGYQNPTKPDETIYGFLLATNQNTISELFPVMVGMGTLAFAYECHYLYTDNTVRG